MIKNIFILVLIALVLFLLFKLQCGKGNNVPDVSEKIDTTYDEAKGDTVYVPFPVKVIVPGKSPIPKEKWRFDTLYTYADTAAILRDYNSVVIYSDTLKNNYGHVVIDDTIFQNRNVGRGSSFSLMIPTITKTITVHEKPKNQVYAGGGVFGNGKDFLSGYQVQLNLKTKNNQMAGIGFMQRFQGGNYVSINYSRVIKLKK